MFLQIVPPLSPGGSIGDHVHVGDGQLLPHPHLLHDEQLLLVSDIVPVNRAVGLARMVDTVDDGEHSHQTVVSKHLGYEENNILTVLLSPERQSVGEKNPIICFGTVFVKHAPIYSLFMSTFIHHPNPVNSFGN